MKSNVRRIARALCVGLVGAAGLVFAQSQSAYRYAVPQGWHASVSEGIEMLSAPATASGSEAAQLLLMGPKPTQGEFQAQFDSERAALEAHWGLTAPQPVGPQAGKLGDASYAAYYASYDSVGGVRYVAFMAMAQKNRLAMLVFVATTPEGFNRLAPQAAGVLQSLRFAR